MVRLEKSGTGKANDFASTNQQGLGEMKSNNESSGLQRAGRAWCWDVGMVRAEKTGWSWGWAGYLIGCER